MFNGRDAEICDTGSRPFVTAVKEVQVEGKEKARASQPVISIFETGIRMRIRPVVTASTIEVDCHLQLKEITDVKVLHLAHWESEESEISEASAIELNKLLEGISNNRVPPSGTLRLISILVAIWVGDWIETPPVPLTLTG